MAKLSQAIQINTPFDRGARSLPPGVLTMLVARQRAFSFARQFRLEADLPKFLCLRLFIAPIEAHLFTRPATHEDKVNWLRTTFLKSTDYKSPRGGEFALRITESRGQVYFGKLSKKQYYELHEKAPDDISERSVEDWPYVSLAADLTPQRQVFVVEDNSTVFRKPDVLARVLTEMANEAMYVHGYAASFEPLVREESFWQLVEAAQEVFAVTFRLRSPNLFGASSNANSTLKQLQSTFHNTETEVTLRNEKGQLTLPKERLDSYREYADKGGGGWELTLRSKGKARRKRKVKSSDRALRVTIDVSDDAEGRSSLRAALSRFLDLL
jgi:hypothetical protein